jgi:hypothetical protein
MPQTPQTQLQNLVQWSFVLAEQGQVTRYGTLKDAFYKQFLPGGIEVPAKHPVKQIDARVYDLAHRHYLSRLKKS